MDKEYKDGQWSWMMKYCKKNAIPAAQSWAWNKALEEYNKTHSKDLKKMYKFRTVFDNIEKVEIVKETAKQYVYKDKNGHERREAKKSSYTSIHNTFEDAKKYLINKKITKIKKMEFSLRKEKQVIELVICINLKIHRQKILYEKYIKCKSNFKCNYMAKST